MVSDDDPLVLLLRLGPKLALAGQRLAAEADAVAADFGLGGAQWRTLAALVAAGPDGLSAAALGRAVGVSRQAALRQLDDLVERRMARRDDDPRDARAPRHVPTPTGRAIHDAAVAGWRGRAGAISGVLGASGLVGLERGLDDLVRAVAAVPGPSGGVRARRAAGRPAPSAASGGRRRR